MDKETLEIIDTLRQQIQAEQEHTAAKDRLASETAKLRAAEQARVARLDEIVNRYANGAEANRELITVVSELTKHVKRLLRLTEKHTLGNAAMREWMEEFSQEIAEIKYCLLLSLSDNPDDLKQIKDQLKRSLLMQQYQNLNTLKLREAKAGASAPLDLLNQIRDIESEIQRLEGGGDDN